MDAQKREIPADLARAGEARHFIAWRGAVAGLGGGRLNDLAVAAEAVLTDILLSANGGVLEIESGRTDDAFEVRITHPELEDRRMSDLAGILERFLDGYEITPTRAVLVKRLD
ncbi:MAG: ATP-binding protein [Actinobacteria bacterium]|nr:ATP-binding protein [Actinomycetota bacterium]